MSRRCVAVCCSVLQCAAVCFSVLHYEDFLMSQSLSLLIADQSYVLQVRVLQCVAVCCSVLQCVAVCSELCLAGDMTSRRPLRYLYLQST